jgi:hypothetical protein
MLRQLWLASIIGLKQNARNVLFLVLLVILPPTFITLSFLTTPDVPMSISVPDEGSTVDVVVGMPTLHGAIMVPMTVAFLSGMVGLFVMLTSREADQRLVMSGYPALLLLGVRLGMIAILSLLVTFLSIGVTAIDFVPPQMGTFMAINFISALHYAFLGAIVGTFLSAMSGTYVMFFTPMIDIGLVQNPMFTRDSVAWWVPVLPGYFPMEVLVDASFSAQFDSGPAFVYAALYLLGLVVIAGMFFWRVTTPRGRRTGALPWKGLRYAANS